LPVVFDAGGSSGNTICTRLRQVGDPVLQGPTRTPYYERAIADYDQLMA
jgi:hypothetical protein